MRTGKTLPAAPGFPSRASRNACNARSSTATEVQIQGSREEQAMKRSAGVYVQSNDADENEIVAFDRDAGGRLTRSGSYPTGGRGSGKPHLPSQGSIAVSADGLW